MSQSDADSWADAGVQALQQSTAEQVRNSVSQALPVNPDAEAQTRRYAAAAQVPLPTARALPDQTKVQAQMSTFDADVLARHFPSTAQMLTNPDLAKITHDDIPATTKVEQTTTAVAKPQGFVGPPDATFLQRAQTPDFWTGIAKYIFSANDGTNNLASDVGSAAKTLSSKIGETASLAVAPAAMAVDAATGAVTGTPTTSAQDAVFQHTAQFDRNIDQGAAAGAQDQFHNKLVKSAATLGLQLPAMLATGGGGAAIDAGATGAETLAHYLGGAVVHGAKSMALPALTDATDMMRQVYEKTGDMGAAARAGQAQFAVSTAGGVVPLSAPGGLAVRMLGGAAVGAVQGELSRQGMNAVLPDSMQTPFNPEELALGAATGSMTAGFMGPGAENNRNAAVRALNDGFDAARTEGQNQQLIDLAKASAASKLRERDPEAFKQFVKDTADQGEGSKGIYIDSSALTDILNQHGITADELRQTMPDVADQLHQANDDLGPTNSLVKIPIEDFATHIAGSPLEEPLMQHLRVDPEGGTVAESEAYHQSQVKDLTEQAGKLTEANASDAAYQASLDKVNTDLTTRLGAIGMKPDIAAANATPLSAFYQVHADRLGILPHEFAERYPVKFSNSELKDEPRQFNQNAVVEDKPVTSQVTDRQGDKYDVSVGKKVFGVDQRSPNSVLVEMHDPATGERRGFVDFAIRPDGVLTSEMTRVAPNLRGRGIAEAMYKAARDAGYDIAPGKVQTDMGAAMVDRLQAKGLINKDAEGKRYSAGDLDLVPLNGDTLAQDARGTFSPSSKTISVLKGADLSTFQHELGHYFLDTLSHLASQPDAPPTVKGDMATLLKWFDVPDLNSWHSMSVDEQRASHEQFATGWETYLMKGQAPTLELRSLFSRFRSWMLNVYKSLSKAPGDFTPEVRGVFDRMIASQDAIDQAEQARRYMPLFDSPEKSGMTPEEWAAYQATGKDATERAIEQLIGKTMKDMAWMDRLRTASLKAVTKQAAEQRSAIVREVKSEVMSQPVYRAWSFLTGKDTTALPDEVNAEHNQAVRDWSEKRAEAETEAKTSARSAAWEAAPQSKETHKNNGLAKGQWLSKNRARIDLEIKSRMLDYDAENPKPVAPEKNTVTSNDPTVGAGKLNTDALKSAFGPEVAAKLYGMKMTGKKGMEPGIVADMFGFPDAESLVKALVESEPPKSVVEGMSDQRMLERHGEVANPQALAATADELVHNEVRARFVATEFKALKKATGTPKEIVAAAKEAAGNTIDTKRIRDINEGQFNAAETRSAKQAERAMSKGDTAGAAIAKRDQILNMELGRAARDAKAYVESALEYLKKFDKPSTREAIDLDYRDQIDALLDRGDLRKSVSGKALDKREALQSFVERMAAAGYKPQIPEGLLNEAQTWHYKDMPFVAFKGLVDSVKSIEHLGKMKSKLLDLQEQRSIDELANEVKDSAAKLPQRTADSNRGLNRMESAWVKTKSFGRSAQAAMLKMEQMFDWLDARNPNGALNRVVFRRLSEAGVHENNLLARVKGDIDHLVDSHLADITKERGKIYTADGLIDGATNLPQKFTTKEMLMLAGNMGNESNAAKMAKGEKWDQAQVWAFLHANMTPAHWDFVEGMGKALESLWPEKLAMDRRLGNTSPEKIAPRPFTTADGKTRSGWYWPLMYDPARAQDVAERGARAGDQMFENIYSKANTDTGRMNTRNEDYARPLLLDLDALPRMIKDEIHDISHREAVIDADKFLSHPTVRKAIVSALSQEHYDQLRPWLQSIANDGKTSTDGARGMEFFNTIAREARTRATIVGLGFRVTTALVHGMSAGAESVSELGAKWMYSGMKDFANPMQWAANKDFIFERSGEMRNRMNEVDRDVREHLRAIDTRMMDPTTGAVARGADTMKAHAYSMIAGLDMASALPTWMGAYKKAMTPVERGGLALGEQDAVYYADKTVRNAHGGTGIKDLARVQRGTEFQKLFTMFYTFWNHNVNRIIDTSKLVTSPEHRAAMKEANNWTNTQLASTVIMRTLVYTIGVQVLHSLVHPPKKEDDGESWAKWAAKELAASAFAGIPIARDISAHYITGKDYSVTPAASMVDAVGKTGTDMANALTGKEPNDKWLKHTINTAGYVFALPTGQLSSGAQFLWDVADGSQHPQSAKDWWNGLLHGETKTH